MKHKIYYYYDNVIDNVFTCIYIVDVLQCDDNNIKCIKLYIDNNTYIIMAKNMFVIFIKNWC